MINMKNLEINIEKITVNLAKRNFLVNKDFLLTLYKEIKEINIKIELLNQERNKNKNPQRGVKIKEELTNLNLLLNEKNNVWNEEVTKIPNLLHDTVPDGNGEEDNPVIKVCEGLPTPKWNINLNRQDIDTETGAMLAGARFTVLKGDVAKTQRKLINEAMDFYELKVCRNVSSIYCFT